MRIRKIVAGVALMGAMAACQSTPDLTVAEYCAIPDNALEHVCQVAVDVNGTKTALADTDLRLSDARSMADSAMKAAERAQGTADHAMEMAEQAQAAASSIDDLYCETNTIQKTNIGSCPANFRLMSCTQTRYTTRAGGLSFLREIDDEQCRFNARVLEMKVRCCTVASARPATTANFSTPLTQASN